MFEFLFDNNLLLIFLFTAARISGIIFTAPLFGSENVPPRIRLFFSIMLAIIIFPLVKKINLQYVDTVLIILIVIKELLIGISIGLLSRFLFVGIQFGGQVIGTQMGFGIVSVLDPQTNSQISLIAQFQNVVMILIFLGINGHIYVIQSIVKSIEMVPLATFVFPEKSYIFIVATFSKIFVTALKITAPVLVTLLVTQVVMGIIARLVPQLNILVIGFPIQISAGMVVMILSMTYFFTVFESLMFEYLRNTLQLFKILGG